VKPIADLVGNRRSTVMPAELGVYSDPLVVYPMDGLEVEYTDWREACEEYGTEDVGRFAIPVAPDSHHKDNVSGGPSYCIFVPNGSVTQHWNMSAMRRLLSTT
jgi:hypothetical protein